MTKEKTVTRKVGIIGYGRFGKLVETLVPEGNPVLIYDRHGDTSLEEVCKCDILILSVPLSSYDSLLSEIAQYISPEQLVVDVCSVKLVPEKLLKRYLPNHPSLLITHPLFGPQSYHRDPSNNRLIVTQKSGTVAEEVLKYCTDSLGLEIINITADEHDRIMARVHALTFFMARGLANLNLPEEKFMTPSYEKILTLVNFNNSHSNELFETIESGNPYAKEMRQEIIETLTQLDKQIEDVSS